MRRILLAVIFCCLLTIPVEAAGIVAPEVPDTGLDYMPGNTDSFGDGLLELGRNGVELFRNELNDTGAFCFRILAWAMLLTVLPMVCHRIQAITSLTGTVAMTSVVLQHTNTMIGYASSALREICEYGKLLCPVMTTALAAQGGITASSLLYGGTTAFIALLSTLVSNWLIPMLYLFLLFSVTHCGLGDEFLKRLAEAAKNGMGWILKTLLIIFTTYMSITGVISGTTDAAALKAAKVTISSVVPVIGGILSDASESVLVSMGVVKNAAGIYGILAVTALFLGPFVKLGLQYLLLKTTAAVCGLFADRKILALMESFSTAMGLLLAMVASGCVLVLVSTVCFMKGMSG